MVGWYSLICTPASSSSPHRPRDARRTMAVSMCSPGTRMRTRTPRFAAATSARRVMSSGTKYALAMSMLRVAAVMDR